MPIFRSQHQAELLTWLFLRPTEEFTLSELARRLAVSGGTLHAEATRLIDAGLISDRMIGRSRLLRANLDARAAAPLAELLAVTFGPEVVIAQEFEGIGDVEKVIIYGSWARRHSGERGREPADVDVMLIGAPDRDEVYAAAERSEQRLAMTVNPTIRSARAWREKSDALVVTAKGGPHLEVVDHSTSKRLA